MRVLVVEDDPHVSNVVAVGLRDEGHEVDLVSSGINGPELALWRDYDVLVLDRMLPGMDGLAIVKALRSSGRQAPVLLLTSMGGVDDRVEGLGAGADDYRLKPFAFCELLAGINALGRRLPTRTEEITLRVGDLEMDLIGGRVQRSGREIELQPRQFRLPGYLMRNRGRVPTRTMLLERVREFHFDPKTNVVETHVSRLRAKIDRPFEGEMIRTVRGSGSYLNVPS